MGTDHDLGTRIWVQQAAIEGILANTSTHSARQRSFRTSSSSLQNSFHGSLNGSFSSSYADNDSCVTDSSSSSNSRNSQWGWRSGYLVNSDSDAVVVKLDSPLPEILDESDTLNLSPTAIQDGLVVLSNDFPVSEEGQIQPPHDLITLTHLHEPAVVESLQHRYANDQIYTYTGPVLLALNPFQSIRGLYGESVMRKYFDRAEKNAKTELPPHIYAIADSSYRNMMRQLEESLGAPSIQANQSILVSGESGSGKTVSTKFLMKYLAALSQRSTELQVPEKRAYLKVQETKGISSPRRSAVSKGRAFDQPTWAAPAGRGSNVPHWRKPKSSSIDAKDSDNLLSGVTFISGEAGTGSIEAQVLQSNPILESFGNARTVRNDNSSRFGKFIEIQFTRTGKLVGAKIDTYLLEKVRLVTQSLGERNYHIFYELLSGDMDARELNGLFLARTAAPEDFKITAGGTYGRRDGVSDRETYHLLRQALHTMKFTNDDVKDILRLTAAILHASNLTFVEHQDDTCSLDKMNVHLDPVCQLVGVTAEELEESLCSFKIKAGSNCIRRSLSKERANKGLQGLLKATYGALFDYLVRRINNSIGFKQVNEDSDEADQPTSREHHRPVACIGILDIFGFESFARNSFEQLCINYCNEALQHQFNAFVLKNEQAEYEREGIEWSFIEFPENQDVLDLLEKRGTGLLSILDDQCRAPGPSDKAFAFSLYNGCKGQSRFMTTRKQQANLQFSVLHYAGPVTYTAEGFVEKNRDEFPKESMELLRNSTNTFVSSLSKFLEHEPSQPMPTNSSKPPTPAKLHRSDSVLGRPTVSEQFKRQLKLLRQKIELTTPHFVRCLKPNDALVPDTFEQAVVADQLRCGGILEAVRVARAGFTQHYPHADFVRRYRALAWKEFGRKTVFSSSPCNRLYGRSNCFGSVNGRSHRSTGTSVMNKKSLENSVISDVDVTDLVKVLYRKLLSLEMSDNGNPSDSASVESTPATPKSCHSLKILRGSSDNDSMQRGTTATTTTNHGFSSPSIARRRAFFASKSSETSADKSKMERARPASTTKGSIVAKYSLFEGSQRREALRPTPATPSSGWKKGGPSTDDFARVGLQIGKTKVFLRHQTFEALERIRSAEQARAATKLNAVFRRYLARLAYVPVRNAFRLEVQGLRERFDASMGPTHESADSASSDRVSSLRTSFLSDRGYCFSLVDKWYESQIRDAIHNPVPRHQWGRLPPSKEAKFKWVISDGIWVKNYQFDNQ